MKAPRESSTALLDRLRVYYQRARTFLLRDIWLVDSSTTPYAKAFVVRQVQVLLIVVRGFWQDHQCLLRASALTYTTLLALVPMLAFMFAFLKGLGIQNRLEPLLIDKLAVGSEETVRMIVNYINNVQVGTLGVIGLGSLLFSTLLQLGTVEKSLNEIWGVREGRTLVRRISDYLSLLVIAPVLLLVAITATAAVKNQAVVAALLQKRLIGDAVVMVFTFLDYGAVWSAFTFFYVFIPNTRVKLVPALIGGIFAGSLWRLAQWTYIEFQVGLTRYSAIYGAFAQLPVLMVWLYISWVIVLLGAELSFACQNVTTYPFERFASLASFAAKERLVSLLYFSLVRGFRDGAGPWSAVAFAQRHRIPIRLMREMLDILTDAKLMVEDGGKPEHYVPGRDPNTTTPWHILRAIRQHGDQALGMVMELDDACATTLLNQLQEAQQQVAGRRSITQWLTEPAGASDRT
jgi:membrane protein